MEKTYPVSKYLSAVKKLITTQIPEVWVNGVITQISERGRMVYLSIAEFEEGDVRPKAKLDLFLFAGEYAQMLARLSELPTPFVLKEQLKVNLYVEADFYVGTGRFQGHVRNIDPNFTVGELARTRAMIMQRLEKEGLVGRNKALPFALLPLKVGLITGEATAAYKDFTTTLLGSGYAFEVCLEKARMQGDETETTVLKALAELGKTPDLDVICIVRGGGSKTDLNYFDSEALCRAIALSPIPILTGIGHQIDESLVDKVSFKSCITPTDCAKFLVARCDESVGSLRELLSMIAHSVQTKLWKFQSGIHAAEVRISGAVRGRISGERRRLLSIAEEISRAPSRTLEREREKLRRDIEGLSFGAKKIIALQKAKFEVVEAKVQANDPKRILARGFSFATSQKGVIKSITDAKAGDELLLHVADGTIRTVVSGG